MRPALNTWLAGTTSLGRLARVFQQMVLEVRAREERLIQTGP